MLSKALTVWLAIVLVTYSSSAPSANKASEKSHVKHYEFSKSHNVSHTHLSYNGSHIVFGLCHDNDSKKNCLITLNSLTSTIETRSCLVTINATTEDNKIDRNVVVALLLNDRALVLSKEGETLKLVNVNLHGCDKREAELATDEHILAVNVVAYENSYDVFFANSKLCQKRFCRITFDNDGKIAKQAGAWGDDWNDDEVKFRGQMQTVANHSPVSGFIVKNMAFRYEPYVSFVNNEGNKLLTVRAAESAGDVAISTIGNYIGTCASGWVRVPANVLSPRTLECKKFDFDGKLVKTELQINLSSLVGDNNEISYMSRLDLPEGFLLFTVICPLNHCGGCTGVESYFVYHIDGNGKTLKSIEISDFGCQKGTEFSLSRTFVNNAEQACVSFRCSDWPVKKLTTGVRCFTNDELQ